MLRSFKIINNNNNNLFKQLYPVISKRFKRQNETFLNPTNGAFLEDIYNSWLRDPQSVEKSWDHYFRAFNFSSGIFIWVIYLSDCCFLIKFLI